MNHTRKGQFPENYLSLDDCASFAYGITPGLTGINP